MSAALTVIVTFIITQVGNMLMARHYLRLGCHVCRDDRPGSGKPSGRHARVEWPEVDPEATVVLRDEVRA